MIKKAVRMKLYPGVKEEYARRHNEIWPEMRQMLKEHGAISYSIFLDNETNYLFGYLEIKDEGIWASVPDTQINRKWWTFMKDMMETNDDESPVTIELEQVFEL